MASSMSACSGPGARCLAVVVLGLLAAAPGAAQDEKGVYAPLELRRGEPNDLIDTSAQYYGLFERRALLYQDPQLLALVQRIGHELAPPATDDYIDYRFHVLRDPSPNAFAFPNGHVYVHTGMLARMADESQLAALLAHEINHVAGHHTILSHRITVKRFAIQVLGGSLASLMGQLRYSRQLEQEADDRAPQLMRETGYDPHAMPELLEILAQDFEGLDPRLPTIWTTHPDTDDRIERSREVVSAYARRDRDPGAFDDIVHSLRAITIRDYIQDDYPYTAIALAQDLLARYPGDLDFQLLLGDAWLVLGPRSEFQPEELSRAEARRNLRRRVWRTREERREQLLATPEGRAAHARNLEQARLTYAAVLEREPEYAAAHRGLGRVHEALGRHRQAARSYLAYVRAAPDAPDRAIVMDKLAALRDLIEEESTNETQE